MTLLTYMTAFLCILVAGIGIGFAANQKRLKDQWQADVRKLEAAVEEGAKALKGAEVDVEIVRALREGEIGLDDLQEVGFDNVQQEGTGRLRALPPATTVAAQAEYMEFVALPYERATYKIEDMVPGDEVWISLADVHHDRDGRPRLWKRTRCTPTPTKRNRTRLRFYKGKHELGIDPDDPTHTSSTVTRADWWIDLTVILAPEDRWPEAPGSVQA